MNELNQKRNRIARQFNLEQKLSYFKQKREEMLLSKENSIPEVRKEASELRELIRRSLRSNELLAEIRTQSLLLHLNNLINSTTSGRVIELMLALLGNLLLDDISLDEKLEIAHLCILSC